MRGGGGSSGGGSGGNSDGGRGSGGTRVYVGGLDRDIKKEDLEYEFEKYGKLNSVWVAYNPPGFAFIEFAARSDAETACNELNNAEVLGTKLRVEISRGRGGGRGNRSGGRGGGRGGSREDRGRSGGRGRGGGRGGGGRGGGGFRGGRGSGFGGRGGGGGGGGRGRDYGGGGRDYGGDSGRGSDYRGSMKDNNSRNFQSNGYGREPRFRSRSPVNNRFSGVGRRNTGGDNSGRHGGSGTGRNQYNFGGGY